MKEYRAAIVGCGSRTPDHIDAYNYIENARVTACCGRVAEKRQAIADRYGIRGYQDLKTMVAEEAPDIIHLVTWPNTRVSLMTAVAELNVPLCVVEKPIATEVNDWKKLRELETKAETRFAVSHQVRWQTDLRKCQDAMNSSALGKPLFLDISAGMNISGQGTHTLNYGRSLIGDPLVTSVFGQIFGWDAEDSGHPAPLASEAYLTFDNGCRGLWTSGPVSPRCGDPETTWQHVRVAAYAETGRVNYEEFATWEIVTGDHIKRGDFGGMDNWRKNNIMSQAGLSKAMFTWLEGGAPVATNLKVSLHEWAVVLALYQSAR